MGYRVVCDDCGVESHVIKNRERQDLIAEGWYVSNSGQTVRCSACDEKFLAKEQKPEVNPNWPYDSAMERVKGGG